MAINFYFCKNIKVKELLRIEKDINQDTQSGDSPNSFVAFEVKLKLLTIFNFNSKKI